ncbi:efflux RND transporter periplasmic adaptor subunit [Pleurocapsa sp. PCC 7319]|uniref:efflux RND transporter periplasmic adaptor subunit n=1 Tax=Pleurocapsa sp. PCC 7319 TaxID=118161 RepID=UPI00037BFB12|nr:efflux RND transporter periplasmic adaptor subunit [Pleurocapsa sp. PCC 7319]
MPAPSQANNWEKPFVKSNLKFIWLVLGAMSLIGCSFESQNKSQTSQPTKSNLTNVSLEQNKINVDVEVAGLGFISSERKYTGTTQPQQEVSWRSQTEGILLELSTEVGDRVAKGELIGQLDDLLLAADVAGREGELATLESELAQAKIQVKNAQISLEEAEIQLEQAKSDAQRYQRLAATGLIAQQQAESFQTAARVAEKVVLTAQEAVKTEEKAVAVVQGRIATQQSAIAESQQRQTYSQIVAPISGIVTARASEPGSLIQAGEEVVTIGDFSQIKIVVPLSELDLGQVVVGQRVGVKLDAYGDRQFTGQVSRIAPTTNNSSRQIPVEIIVDNPERQIKGGLLARVNFVSDSKSKVIVPESALKTEEGANYIFAVTQTKENNQGKVTKRKVVTGDRANGKVEITAGISPGERYVIRSSQPLQDRDEVGLSIISQ